MFTGLISDVGEILSIEQQGQLRRIRIACSYKPESIAIGASIACSGPCLTATVVGVENGRTYFDTDVGAETLARTTAGAWKVGDKLNLERSLQMGDELGGHMVSGHVDGVAEILDRTSFDGMAKFEIRAQQSLARFIAEKGSLSLDGTSLTVNSVYGDRFSVLLIPHTLAVTTWGAKQAGDKLNIEADTMARYAARLIEVREAEHAMKD
jgi:riboflavin synthase